MPIRLTGSSSTKIKSHNMRAILLALLHEDEVSRAYLARTTGLSSTTITNLVTELLEKGIVVEEGAIYQSGAGRPQTVLQLVPSSRYAIGVHFDVDNIRVAVTNLLGELQIVLVHKLAEKSAEVVLQQTLKMIHQTIDESTIAKENLVGIGIGMSGLVDPETGINVVAPNLGWQNVPVKTWFEQKLPYPICVENGVRAMALGETMFGAGAKEQVHTLAVVYARIGVGSGYVVDGQMYQGSGAGAGEIGHITMIPENGIACRCGNYGCLETLFSEPAIIEHAKLLAQENPDSILANYLQNDGIIPIEAIFSSAREGDLLTRQMLHKHAEYMGIALANLVNILNPELIVLGGLFVKGADILLPMIKSVVQERAFANLGEKVQLQVTEFSQNIGVIGASALALDTFFYQQSETWQSASARVSV